MHPLSVFLFVLRLTLTGTPADRRAAMMTRSMAASQVDDPFLTPPRNTVKSPSLSSSSCISSPSSRRLPTPPSRQPQPQQMTFICEACLNAKSTLNSSNSNCFPKLKLNEFDPKLNVLFNNLESKTELIGKKISTIECSLSNHNVIINEMERRISDLANKLINLSSNLSKYVNYVSSPSNLTLSRPSSVNVNVNKPSSSVVRNRRALTQVKSRNITPLLSTEGHRPADVPRVAAAHIKPNSVLCLGDSNTRYVMLAGPHVEMRREPTYTIEAIDPHKVAGYQKVWIHVGINSLKRQHCRNMTEVKQKFEGFMSKVGEIKAVNPNIKVIISPILPTAIPELNSRARYFNSLLFSQKRWWGLLGFDVFCNSSGELAPVYRRYKNQNDKIHLGYNGINLLTSKIRAELSLVDGRSFASVVSGTPRPSLQ